MSDIRTGWAELLSAPLGPEPQDPTPLALLPSLYDLNRETGPLAAARNASTGH